MLRAAVPYIYLSSTILLSVYSQLMIKWRISSKFSDTHLPDGLAEKFFLMFRIVFDPFIFSGLVATFASGLFWMATMTKLDISYAYPFTSLGFVLVLIFSVLLFGEPLNAYKIIGVLCIMLGIFITSKG